MVETKRSTLEEAVQILDIYFRNAADDGDDVSMEQDALARVLDELSDLDAYDLEDIGRTR
jgi:hypothetical protein